MKVLQNGLEILNASLDENPTSLPLSPTLQVSGVHARGSSYFQSNTLPLKILFLAKDGSTIPAIYKVIITILACLIFCFNCCFPA